MILSQICINVPSAESYCIDSIEFLRSELRFNSGFAQGSYRLHQNRIEGEIENVEVLGAYNPKHLNNVVEQDHRAIKCQVQPMMGFKSFSSAAVILANIELMHMIRKGQLRAAGCLCQAQQFYSLAS
jgi:hypothetical protein